MEVALPMQVVALVMDVLIAPPSPNAAAAMPVPTIARMSAYSAAAAPESSFRSLKKVVMSSSLRCARAAPGERFFALCAFEIFRAKTKRPNSAI